MSIAPGGISASNNKEVKTLWDLIGKSGVSNDGDNGEDDSTKHSESMEDVCCARNFPYQWRHTSLLLQFLGCVVRRRMVML